MRAGNLCLLLFGLEISKDKLKIFFSDNCVEKENFMSDLSYLKIQDTLNQADLDDLPKLNVSILRNVMVEPIEPYLKYFSYKIGFGGNVVFGEYDNIFQEAVGGNKGLLNSNTDCVLIFSKLENLSWDLSRNYSALKPNQVRSEIERIKEFIQNVLSGIRSQTDGMILWHGFETPVYPVLGIIDAQSSNGQTAVINELNEQLKTFLGQHENAYMVDINNCLAKLGYQQFYDLRYWHIGKAPYSRDAMKEIAEEIFKYIRPLKGKNKKCLILDCDNVLWGGIIGEDGLAGIQLGKSYPGSCYYEFQQEVLNLYNRGIIIALCSKNNEEDVWEVFRKHPDMLLKEEHIAMSRINWEDKATNLQKIAMDLNIGLDSVVFADDSEFEVNLIQKALPDVEVIHMPRNKAVIFRDILVSCGWFDTLTLSEEDRKRGALYKAEINRKKLQSQAIDMNTYYKSLEMKLCIHFADDFAIPRLAQLTQKTNQFNLTTKRYSEADIKNLSKSASSDVLHVRLIDKFGDTGIVGVFILKHLDKKALIDTFLLSCRVLGRGVEDAFLSNALKLAQIRGCEGVIGEYYATQKNGQVVDFYEKRGFVKSEAPTQQGIAVYYYDLHNGIRKEPDFFAEIDSEIGKP